MAASRALYLIDSLLNRKAKVKEKPAKSAPTQADFGGMVKSRQRELHALTAKLQAGELTVDEWYMGFQAVILEGHTSAWEMGRGRAGDLEDDINDLLRGLGKADQEEFYLRGFAQALRDKDSRYWDAELDVWKLASIKARQNLYMGPMRGTANEAFVTHTPVALDEFDWVDTGGPDECDQCVILAEEGPYTISTIPTYPGAGATPCWGNCECHLRRSDGVTGFYRVEL